MWVFGYGSLMFDNWQVQHNCVESSWANLVGYRRSFNKKSIVSRGTVEAPGLTLNLEEDKASICRGRAFQFADGESAGRLLSGLCRREDCPARELGIELDDKRIVSAYVFIYEGVNLTGAMSLADRAAMTIEARGKRGSGVEYIQMIFEGLKKIGVEDPAVSEFWEAVKRAQNKLIK